MCVVVVVVVVDGVYGIVGCGLVGFLNVCLFHCSLRAIVDCDFGFILGVGYAVLL